MSFKFYSSSPILGEFPVVILTVQSEEDGETINAEYFVCVHTEKDQHYFPLKLYHSSSKALRDSFGISEEFILQQALDTAQSRLDQYLYQRYEATKNHVYLDKRFSLNQIDKSAIVGFYLRGLFQKQFKAVQEETRSEQLAKLLREIFRLRAIIYGKRILNTSGA